MLFFSVLQRPERKRPDQHLQGRFQWIIGPAETVSTPVILGRAAESGAAYLCHVIVAIVVVVVVVHKTRHPPLPIFWPFLLEREWPRGVDVDKRPCFRPSATKSGRPCGVMYVSSWWTPLATPHRADTPPPHTQVDLPPGLSPLA